jgi:hypothetical protein
MRSRLRLLALLAPLGILMIAFNSVHSDEGMWLFNQPPTKLLKERHNFDVTKDWLEHLQKSSVRFNTGGSGSFVSGDGLVMTNHHVGADQLQKMSSQEKDYLKDGYYAKSPAEEVKCPDLELNVLMEIEDVTDRVNGAVKPSMDAVAAQKARKAVMNTIEKESTDKTGLRSDVVTLFQGGMYHLYRFKKYTDVRLVFAPEKTIAFFGGDPDNFEYPRYDLDICFFRVYEDGKAVKPQHFLKWSEAGCKDGDLTFVSGHPGRTDRLNTVKHLQFLRDTAYPLLLDYLRRKEILLKTFGDRSKENMRRAEESLFSIQNSRKARLGGLAGLQDPGLMKKKETEEKALQDAVANDPKLKKEFGDAWDQIERTINVLTGDDDDGIYVDHLLLERGRAFQCDLFEIARTLVRLAEETTKPNADRLREFGEARLESLKIKLFSDAPIYDDLETVELADSLSYYMEMIGADNDLLQKVLDGKSPQNRASELIRGTKLKDVSVRKKLADGGKAAIEACNDPMIQLAKLVDEKSREVRKRFETEVDEVQQQAYAKIAKAVFAAKGADTYPDATFTLRLAFGLVKGYEEDGKAIPAMTRMGGAYKHAANHDNKDPFELPKRWMERKDRLNPETPFNFVSTADIIGGNSGSPVVNRKGELVGIIFDGNIQSLVLDFVYTDEVARAVSVHSASIIEALRKIYEADKLADELTGKKG